MASSVADDPKLASLWDAGQNPQPASKLEARSFRPAVWRCANGHTFQRSPRAMQNDASCPTCSEGVNTHTNLGKLRPALASLWDAEKNPGITFATLDATHASAVWLPERAQLPAPAGSHARRRRVPDVRAREDLARRARAQRRRGVAPEQERDQA